MALTNEWQEVASDTWTSGGFSLTFYLEARVTSQSGLTSYIDVRLCSRLGAGSSGYTTSWKYTATFCNDSETIYGQNWTFDNEVVISGSGSVQHNENGKGSITLNGTARIAVDGVTVNYSMSNTVDLPDIPREAKLTVNNNTLTVGDTLQTSNSPFVSGFTYTLIVYRGSTTLTLYNKQSYNSYSVNTLSAGFYQLFQQDETQCMATIQLITYSGDNVIGSDGRTLFLTKNSAHNPSVSISSVDTGKVLLDTTKTTLDLTGNSKRIISGWNAIQTTWSATSNSGGSITNVSINGTTVSNSPVTLNDINNTLTIVATDSYGLSSTLTESDLTFIPYETPSIVPTVKRNTSTDGRVNLTFVGMFYNTDFGKENNTLTLDWYVKEKGSSTYTRGLTPLTYTSSSGNTNYESSATISLANPLDANEGLFDYTKAYEFKFVASDKIASYTIENIIITSGVPNFVVFKNILMGNNIPILQAPVILWTNPNPNSDFSAQTVTLDKSLEFFRFYSIIYKYYRDDTQVYNTGLLPVDFGTKLTSSWELCATRNVNENRTPSQNRSRYMNFSSGMKISGFYSNVVDNARSVPYQIWGWY